MTSKVTSNPLPDSCEYRNIINLESKPSVPLELDKLDGILAKAKELTAEIDHLTISTLPPKDETDHHRVTITSFWIITSILAHSIYTTITDLQTCIRSLENDLQAKLEIDCIALNVLCDDLYRLSRLYLALFRVLTVKTEPRQLNQHARLLELITAKSESLQHYACHYIDSLSAAIGHTADAHPLTAGVHHSLKSVDNFTRIVTAMRRMLTSPPARKFSNFTTTKTGRTVLKWLGITLRTVVASVAPPVLSGALERIMTSLHPIEMLNLQEVAEPLASPTHLSEFSTLKKSTGIKASKKL